MEENVTERNLGKYARIERERRFLLRELPEGLSPRSPHRQLWDNYITGTRLRLRKIRQPETGEYAWKLTQKFPLAPDDFSRCAVTNIYLSRYEYEVFSVFEANEIRKNRYRYEHDGRTYAIDVYAGDLRGLIVAEIEFASDEEMNAFNAPPFAVLEITNSPLFTGARLVDLTTDEIRAELRRNDER